MLPAWQAENISYRRGYYRYWISPKRTTRPSEEEIFHQALHWFKSVYEESHARSMKENKPIGKDAILLVADRIQAEALSQEELGHLARFALQTGAKWALDFASFFTLYNKTLAGLKYSQSRVFGEAHSCLLKKDWKRTAYLFHKLADLAEKIQDELLAY